MTQAFNLSQLANNLNTSGQLDATDGLTGLVPLANGGTGASNTVNSIVAGTGISTSVSGTQVTINSTVTGGVTSLNGQQGAITNTDLGVIGSAVVATYFGSTSVYAGQTVSGSVLYVPNTVVIAQTTFSSFYTSYIDDTQFTEYGSGLTQRRTSGNTGVQPPLGSTTLSGTWRCMNWAGLRYSTFTACVGITYSYMDQALFVRVS